jgi:hypothetical protein
MTDRARRLDPGRQRHRWRDRPAPTLIMCGTGDRFFDVKCAYKLADTLTTRSAE